MAQVRVHGCRAWGLEFVWGLSVMLPPAPEGVAFYQFMQTHPDFLRVETLLTPKRHKPLGP